jgi:hypothetical protein
MLELGDGQRAGHLGDDGLHDLDGDLLERGGAALDAVEEGELALQVVGELLDDGELLAVGVLCARSTTIVRRRGIAGGARQD